MEESLRIRLVFDDPMMLSKSQRSRGLNQSWLLLNSTIATIADLASHVCRIFELERSCHDSLLLSMDDFVLPPFESTCILKDKDIIRVRKKDGTRVDAIEFDANTHNIQYSGLLENGHTISSDKLLAVREFGDDSGLCKRKKAKDLCAHNETTNHTGSLLKPKNKRKHSDEIRGSKKKKLKASSKKANVSGDEDADTAEEHVHLRNSLDSFKEKSCSLKSFNKKDKPSTSNERPGPLVNSQWKKKSCSLKRILPKHEVVSFYCQHGRKKKLKAISKKSNVNNDEDVDTAEGHVCHRNSLDSSKKKSCSLKSSNKKDKPTTSNERPGPLVNSQRENNFGLATSSAIRDESSGQKNLQLVSRENAIISASIAGDKAAEQNRDSFLKTDSSAKRPCKNDTQSDKDGKSDAVLASQPDDCKQPNSVLMEERSVQAEDNIGGNACKPHGNDGGTKVQSRSARRKKAKRQWLKEIKSQQAQNTQIQTPPDINHGEKPELQMTRQDTEMEKEMVPLVIRPGHIRFQPLDEEQGPGQSQTHETTETLQWKGTTSKKKGQMWGQQKGGSWWNEADGYEVQYNREENEGNGNNANSFKKQCNRKEKGGKWNDARDYNKEQYKRNEKTVSKWNGQSNGQNFGNNVNCHNDQSNGKLKIMNNVNDLICHDEQSNGKEKSMSKWNDANGCEKQCNTKANECIDANGSQSNRKAISEEGKTGSGPIDFDSLFPLTRIPQVGDVLAYRLIELSSSWCPEVSSFRVGKVTSYDNLSMIIVLVPVPEYPILTDEDIEEGDSILEANSSQYKEDGSLQIHYPSLVDVRLFKASDLEATASEREMIPQEAAAENNCEPATIGSNTNYTVTQPTENEKVGICGWDEIRQALNEKKEELLKKGGQRKESTPSNSSAGASRSYRALRRNALGPTLAFLRENNDEASL